jgi:outer membrane protein assembly factor BamB
MWRKELGDGYPGPIVSADRVFTVETFDRKREIVRAFDRKTGQQVWERGWDGSMNVPFFSAKNGDWVRSTPAFDGECLYVGGMRDLLVCLDASTGEIRWQVDFMERYASPLPKFGLVCSPLVVADAVYIQAGSGFVKLDKRTGASVWRCLEDAGGMYGSAFSSPVYETILGQAQLVVQTRDLLAGVDPERGEVLWKQEVKAFRGMNIQTPVVVDDLLFTSCYGGASILYKLTRDPAGFSVAEVWRDKKSQGYMSTPVVVGGNIYFHRKDQRFSCLDPATKEILWRSPPLGRYCSLVSNGKEVLALNQKGELLLFEATPEQFNLLDRREIAEQDTWGHLAVAGDQLFVRELRAIAAYRWRNPPLAGSASSPSTPTSSQPQPRPVDGV